MNEHRWYAIQVTAGHENKVRSLIQRRIDEDARPEAERVEPRGGASAWCQGNNAACVK